MRVQHRGVIDVVAVLLHQRGDGQFLHVHIGPHQGDQLQRDVVHRGGLKPVRIDQHRHLDRRALRQLRNEPPVRHVAVDHRRRAGHDRVHDRRGIFLRGRHHDPVGAAVFLGLRLPLGDLLLAADGVFVQRDAERLDQVGAVGLDEPGHIFGEMLAAFGDEIAQMRHHLIPNPVRAARVPA